MSIRWLAAMKHQIPDTATTQYGHAEGNFKGSRNIGYGEYICVYIFQKFHQLD